MALMAPVEDGKFVESASQSSLSKAVGKSSDGMDKDAFLQLLVAQMRYQDPLEPTSNTEYISQYAQFSQVEQMQNMAQSTDLQRASSLVGHEVYIKTTTSSGETKYVQGKVDYVVFENNKAYLSIDESLYALDDLDTIADKEYLDAYEKAEKFVTDIKKLPNVKGIDLSDAEKIDELAKTYEEMNKYEKSFVAKEVVEELNKYKEKIKEIRIAAGLLTEDGEEIPGTEDTEKPSDTKEPSGAGETGDAGETE